MNHLPPLFHIKKLVCAYSGSQTKALVINELIIPRGKLVFLLGSSGTGKSTLLETLGLMNNTVVSGEILFKPNIDEPAQNLASLWIGNHEKEINEVRKKHFSFIFQNTNLMENFTAYENVCLSEMIKGDKIQQEVIKGAEELMHKVKLPQSEVGLGTLANHLSGGQRQRLAFVRALNNNADTLFGDEPTGNVDEANANELMEVIKNGLGNERTAIIVSHDVNLAIRHADIIVVMTKDFEKGYGEVDISNIYEREQWINKSESDLLNFRKSITERFRPSSFDRTDSTAQIGSSEDSIFDLKNSYRRLFFKRESKVLLGKKYSNLVILAAIFFFTFLSIGFANGSLDYLNKQMNSAFVNWVNINVPFSAGKDKLSRVVEELNRSDNKLRYNYSEVSVYYENAQQFYSPKDSATKYAESRTIDMDVSADRKFLKEFVLEDKNFKRGNSQGFIDNGDFSLIVTEAFLRDFGYPDSARFVYLPSQYESSDDKSFLPIPISTVVEKLPGKYYFLQTIGLARAVRNSPEIFSTGEVESQLLRIFFATDDELDESQIELAFRSALNNDLRLTSAFRLGEKIDVSVTDTLATEEFRLDEYIEVEVDTLGFSRGYIIDLTIFPRIPDYPYSDSMWKLIQSAPSLMPFKNKLMRLYSFEEADSELPHSTMPDQVSVYFTNISKVDSFATKLESIDNDVSLVKAGDTKMISVDQTKVKEKQNFLFLSNVTRAISVILILFATAFIGLFNYNLIRTHLNKVKMNLGTFKAIGLSNMESIRIYFKIILYFVLISCVLGLALAFIIGIILNKVIIMLVKSASDISYFTLKDSTTFFISAVVIFASIAVSYITIRKILSKSPGDLIYNR